MLRQLFIQDFALIDRLETSFDPGLSILTGQTGAGKSIIIGALNLVLGERADHDQIRRGASKAVVEAVVRIGASPALREQLRQAELDADAEHLVLRREIRDYGSRAFINDTPVPIGTLRQIGDHLVDLHGQHEHQLLLREDQHRLFLDRYAQNQAELAAYRTARKSALDAAKSLKELRQRERDLRERHDLNAFKLKELDEAGLKEGEDDELKANLNRMEHAEDLAAHASAIADAGGEGEVNAADLLRQMIRHVEAMAAIEPDFAGYRDELETAKVSIEETVRYAAQYAEGIDFNPALLEKMRRRQSDLNRLMKKYLLDLPALIALREGLREELNLAETFDLEIAKLEKAAAAALDTLRKAAELLDATRATASLTLAEKVVSALAELGMAQVRFKTELATGDIGAKKLSDFADHGPGEVRFLIATNRGEDLKPMARIASGGEVSRVMLALKTVLALDDDMPVMIFDEIDTGISGQVSEMVGKAMKKLSKHCQILAITHQPQIAAQADHHYRVEKYDEGERTTTQIVRLDPEEHVREVAALMSGSVITEAALASARAMIGG